MKTYSFCQVSGQSRTIPRTQAWVNLGDISTCFCVAQAGAASELVFFWWGGRAHSHCSCRILSATAKHLLPRAFLVGLWNASVPKEELEILEDDPPWLLEKEHSLAGPQRPRTDRKPWRPSLQQTRSHMEFQYVCPPSTLESDHFLPCKSLHSLWILSASSCAWQDRFNDIYT